MSRRKDTSLKIPQNFSRTVVQLNKLAHFSDLVVLTMLMTFCQII